MPQPAEDISNVETTLEKRGIRLEILKTKERMLLIFERKDDITDVLPSIVETYPTLFNSITIVRTRQDFNTLVCSGIDPFDQFDGNAVANLNSFKRAQAIISNAHKLSKKSNSSQRTRPWKSASKSHLTSLQNTNDNANSSKDQTKRETLEDRFNIVWREYSNTLEKGKKSITKTAMSSTLLLPPICTLNQDEQNSSARQELSCMEKESSSTTLQTLGHDIPDEASFMNILMQDVSMRQELFRTGKKIDPTKFKASYKKMLNSKSSCLHTPTQDMPVNQLLSPKGKDFTSSVVPQTLSSNVSDDSMHVNNSTQANVKDTCQSSFMQNQDLNIDSYCETHLDPSVENESICSSPSLSNESRAISSENRENCNVFTSGCSELTYSNDKDKNEYVKKNINRHLNKHSAPEILHDLNFVPCSQDKSDVELKNIKQEKLWSNVIIKEDPEIGSDTEMFDQDTQKYENTETSNITENVNINNIKIEELDFNDEIVEDQYETEQAVESSNARLNNEAINEVNVKDENTADVIENVNKQFDSLKLSIINPVISSKSNETTSKNVLTKIRFPSEAKSVDQEKLNKSSSDDVLTMARSTDEVEETVPLNLRDNYKSVVENKQKEIQSHSVISKGKYKSANDVQTNNQKQECQNQCIKFYPNVKGTFHKVKLWNKDLEMKIDEESVVLFHFLQYRAKYAKYFLCLHCDTLYSSAKLLHKHLRLLYRIGSFCPIGECTYVILEEVEYLRHIGVHYRTAIMPKPSKVKLRQAISSEMILDETSTLSTSKTNKNKSMSLKKSFQTATSETNSTVASSSKCTKNDGIQYKKSSVSLKDNSFTRKSKRSVELENNVSSITKSKETEESDHTIALESMIKSNDENVISKKSIKSKKRTPSSMLNVVNVSDNKSVKGSVDNNQSCSCPESQNEAKMYCYKFTSTGVIKSVIEISDDVSSEHKNTQSNQSIIISDSTDCV